MSTPTKSAAGCPRHDGNGASRSDCLCITPAETEGMTEEEWLSRLRAWADNEPLSRPRWSDVVAALREIDRLREGGR